MINSVNNINNISAPLKARVQKIAPIKDIKPESAKGELVSNKTLVEDLFISSKDTINDAKNLSRAIKNGKTNDFELGRMNDLGLKIGGLAIASYLATKRFTKTSKMMEFLGFGAFLSSMALWPRLFINAPTRAMYGFNPAQKYKDSQGRKKPFFQDNQYLPWDIWSKEELAKIGDKMGVDKNLVEREEVIKKKMQKIALQDNTLWMLTAGFATPIATSLVCDTFQPSLERLNTKLTAQSLKGKIGKIDNTASNALNGGKNFADFKLNFATKTREDLISSLAKLFSPERAFDSFDDDSKALVSNFVNMENIVRSDLEKMLIPTKIDADKIDSLAKHLKDTLFKNPVSNGFDGTVNIDENILKDLLLKANSCDKGHFIDNFKEVVADSEYFFLNGAEYSKYISKLIDGGKYTKEFDTNALKTLEEQYNSVFKSLFAKLNITAKSINAVVGKRSESLSTATYKDVADKIFKGLKLNSREIKLSKESLDKSSEIMADALSKIAKTPDNYINYIKSVAKGQEKYTSMIEEVLEKIEGTGLSRAIEEFDASKVEDGAIKSIIKEAEQIDPAFKKLKNVFEINGSRNNIVVHFKNFINRAKVNNDAIFTRFVLACDFERKLASNPDFAKTIKSFAPDTIPEDDIIKWCRKMLLDDTMTDFSNKNDIPFKKMYKGLLDTLYNKNSLADETKKAFDSYPDLLKRVQTRISSMHEIADNLKSVEFPYLGGNPMYKMPQGLQYTSFGKPLSELLQETSKSTFNHNKWFKIFGTSFAILAGITILSQKLFGKIKDENLYKKNSAQLNNNNNNNNLNTNISSNNNNNNTNNVNTTTATTNNTNNNNIIKKQQGKG